MSNRIDVVTSPSSCQEASMATLNLQELPEQDSVCKLEPLAGLPPVPNFEVDYQLDRKKFLGIVAIPFMDAFLLFLSFSNFLYQFFNQYGAANVQMVEKQRRAPVIPQALIAMSTLVSTGIFLLGWNNVAKKHLYYKLMARGIILKYEDRAWYKSVIIWLLVLMTACCLVVLYYGASVEVTYPMVVNLASTLLLYKSLLETEGSLIPLNKLLQKSKEAALKWLTEARVIPEAVLGDAMDSLLKGGQLRGKSREEALDVIAQELCKPQVTPRKTLFSWLMSSFRYFAFVVGGAWGYAMCMIVLVMGSAVWFYGNYKAQATNHVTTTA